MLKCWNFIKGGAHKFPKLRPPTPLFADFFEAEVGKGHFLEYSISLVHMLHDPCDVTCVVDNHDNCSKQHFCQMCTTSTCVATKPRGTEATKTSTAGVRVYEKWS